MRASWPCEDIVGGEGSVGGAGAEIIGNYRALEGRESSERCCAPASYNATVTRSLRTFLLGAQRVRVVGLHLMSDTTNSIIRA